MQAGEYAMRTVPGFILAPLIAAVIEHYAAVSIFVGPWTSDYMASAAIMVLYAYVAAILFGVPAYLLLRRLRWGGFLSYVLVGAFIGALMEMASWVAMAYGQNGMSLWASLWLPFENAQYLPHTYALVIACGALGGSAFWLITSPRRDLTSL